MATQMRERRVLPGGLWQDSMKVLLGLVLGLSIAIAIVYFVPRTYMGPAFGNSDMTKSEVIRALEYGRNIHVHYARIRWPEQSFIGSQEFHRSWISTYDQAISYLKQ